MPFSGICRNLERITVSKEGQIKDKSQHMHAFQRVLKKYTDSDEYPNKSEMDLHSW